MSDNLLPDFAVNLAASLTYDLFKAGASWLKQKALGSEYEQALHQIYKAALTVALEQVLADASQEEQEHIDGLLHDFVRQEDNAQHLLGIAFKEEVPLEELKTRFDRQFDSTTIGFDALMRALVDALEDAALEIAAQTESPLFNQIVITMLAEVRDSLRQLKQKKNRPSWEYVRTNQSLYFLRPKRCFSDCLQNR